MAQSANRSAFERLKHHYERTRSTCSACGYEDESGDWTSATDGATARYRHVCPSCGAVEERTLSFDR